MTLYHEMSKAEASAALEEVMRERPPALHRLEHRLREAGEDVDRLLDSSPESLTPLWLWVRENLSPRGDGSQRVDAWPTWLRHTVDVERLLSEDSVVLVDGLTSYLCVVVERGAPQAEWRVGHDRVKNYGWENHPVLAHGRDEFALGEYVAGVARRHLRGSRPELQPAGLPPTVPPEGDNLTVLASSLITKLDGQDLAPTAPDEPLVKAERLADDDHDWELWVSDEMAFEHAGLVDELVAALGREAGVHEVLREDREVILLRAPGWTQENLEAWARDFLRARLPGE
jgi:hypothetical protein